MKIKFWTDCCDIMQNPGLPCKEKSGNHFFLSWKDEKADESAPRKENTSQPSFSLSEWGGNTRSSDESAEIWVISAWLISGPEIIENAWPWPCHRHAIQAPGSSSSWHNRVGRPAKRFISNFRSPVDRSRENNYSERFIGSWEHHLEAN